MYTCPSLIKSGKNPFKNLVIDFFHSLSSSVPVMMPGFLTHQVYELFALKLRPLMISDVPAIAASGSGIVFNRSTLPGSDLRSMEASLSASSGQRAR